jgi:phosphatidylglycerol lysyltransferase
MSDRTGVLALLKRHGWNATSFQVLERGFRYWVIGDACVAYVDTGRAWVVAGSPICAADEIGEVAAQFADEARKNGRRVCFFATEARFYRALPMPMMHIGEQPVWDPSLWSKSLEASRSLREQLRRARAKEVTVRALDAADVVPGAPDRRAIEALVAEWLGARGMAPMRFLVDVQPFEFPGERRWWLAEQGGRVVAFLAAVPVYARGGWLFEDLLRAERAPNGAAELLVDRAMRDVAGEGARFVTLGLAPLAGDVRGWLKAARAWAAALYDFDGVRAFKAKLRPNAWDPIYLAYPPGASGNVALADVLGAFAGGSFARFGMQTLLQGPALVVRALAVLLVPWTAMIALAGPRWFPSPGVRVAWVVFDVLVAASLFALAARWRAWLGALLAASVTADAAITLLEAVLYNAPRARGALDWLVIVVSCLAPAFAAVVLWGRVRRGGSGAPASAAS